MSQDKKYKVVFLDLDDTLWDFSANAKASFADVYALNDLGDYFESFDQFYDIYARRNAELWVDYHQGTITKDELQRERFLYPFAQVGVNNPQLSEKVGREFLETTTSKTILIPHTIELLEYLSGRYSLTILSNGFSEVQYKKIDNSGLRSYFDHIVLSEHIGIQKPNLAIFQHALEVSGCEASEVVMVGDNYEIDILGAKNAHIDQIYFDPKATNPINEATHTVGSLRTIMTIL